MEATLETSSDRRFNQRINTFWLAYNKDDKTVLGYITEISAVGLKIWVNKDDLHDNTFSIYINPPSKISNSPIYFTLLRVWREENVKRNFIEMGCKFENLSDEQKIIVSNLINFFKDESEQFFIEIEEYVNSMKNLIEDFEDDAKNNKN